MACGIAAASALRQLRVGAGLGGARLAEMLGWQQSKVSKIETASNSPRGRHRRLGRCHGRLPKVTSELLTVLRGARIEYAAWKDAYRESGADGVQAGILEIEAQAARVAEFQPALISGLLQTTEYARELQHLPCGPLSYGRDEEEINRMVAERMQRQQVIYQPGRQVQVVMLEGALRARVVSAPTLAGQLDRLMAAIGLPSLELGIIPFDAAVPVWPTAGFRLYDDLVIEESVEGENQVAEPEQVASAAAPTRRQGASSSTPPPLRPTGPMCSLPTSRSSPRSAG
jgi:transcriptional regulator with XRE-family HTH domain